ncbi:MAG: tyrosine-protein phosphatase, partial [Planctomycetes bacterium]|nr:tyrosine-protein phosphatase [Planctomycetota bacterium]
MARAVLILALATLAACSNLHEVDPGAYYRCGQLDADGFRQVIRDHGIRTVVRLRGGAVGEPEYDAAHTPAEEAGAAFVHIQMSALSLPSRETLLRIWETFDTAERPLLVHCKAGADRTGLASAIYVLHETGDLRKAREQLHVLPYL